MKQHYPLVSATIVRAFILWLLSNLGGTLLLGLALAANRFDDAAIAGMAGLIAAIISLPLLPLAVPFLAGLSQLQPGWSRRTMALLGVSLFFLLAQQGLLFFLPFLTMGSLLEMGLPYLLAAWATVFWLYSPAGQQQTAPAALGPGVRGRAAGILRMFRREATSAAV